MTLPTPPRYVVLPHEVIEQAYRDEKPKRALLATFTRILSLAWEAKYQKTPPLSETELIEFLKLSRRQYYEQKAEMEADGWLRSSHPRTGFVQFDFSRMILEKVASAENRIASAENRTHELRKEEEEDVVFNKTDGSSSSFLPDQDKVRKTALTVAGVRETAPADMNGRKIRALIEHLPLLFEADVYGVLEFRAEWIALPDEYALGWITKAYLERGNFQKASGPLGLIVARLNAREAPNRRYLTMYQDVLTEAYLEAVDVIEYECPFCNQVFGKRDALNAHEREAHPYVCEECNPAKPFQTQSEWQAHYQARHDPYSVRRAEETPERTHADNQASRIWQGIKAQLQAEMPRASWDTWVKDAIAVRFDGSQLEIGARNAYARDWLESRLKAVVQEKLAAALNTAVMVQFVVAEAA